MDSQQDLAINLQPLQAIVNDHNQSFGNNGASKLLSSPKKGNLGLLITESQQKPGLIDGQNMFNNNQVDDPAA